MMFSNVTLVPFETRSPYIIRGIEKEKVAPSDREFLKQFDTIFCAALTGNLRKVKEVVERGFRDFHAFSVGRYRGFDHLSILQVAEQKGHVHIIRYLQKFTIHTNEPKNSEEVEEDLSEDHLDISKLTSQLSLHVTSDVIIEKIKSGISEEEIFKSIDEVVFEEGDLNPITYILGDGHQCYKEKALEKCVVKLLEKFPIEEGHLTKALELNFSDELISQFIKKTKVQNHHLREVLEHSCSREIFSQILERVSVTNMKDVKIAIDEDWAYECVEEIFDKVKIYDEAPWDSLFPFKCKKVDRSCWNDYANRPKPYLYNDEAIPISLLKKFLIYFPINTLPMLDSFIGWVKEEVLWLFVDRVAVGIDSGLKQILLCGYSERFVLHLFENIEDGSLEDDDIVKIAQLRNYSEEVVSMLKKKVG